MSDLLDKIESELHEFAATIEDIVNVQSVQKGDPGWLLADQYPYLMVEGGPITPKSETMGRAGSDVLLHTFTISIMVDATDYFDPLTSGNDAEGPLYDAGLLLLLWFRRFSNRMLDAEAGLVRNVTVGSVDFPADARGEVYAKSAIIVLTVEKQYQHQP